MQNEKLFSQLCHGRTCNNIKFSMALFLLCFLCYTSLFFETESHSVVQADLKLTMQPRLASNSWQSSCLKLPSVGIAACIAKSGLTDNFFKLTNTFSH